MHLILSLGIFCVVCSSATAFELNNFLNGALTFVRPLIGRALQRTATPTQVPDSAGRAQHDPSIRRWSHTPTEQDRLLGAQGPQGNTPLEPLCVRSPAVCAFLTCSARNFKNEPSFENINWVASIMADPKLRQAVGEQLKDPGTQAHVCRSANLKAETCSLFVRGFGFVSHLFNFFDKNNDKSKIRRKRSTANETQTQELPEYTEEVHYYGYDGADGSERLVDQVEKASETLPNDSDGYIDYYSAYDFEPVTEAPSQKEDCTKYLTNSILPKK